MVKLKIFENFLPILFFPDWMIIQMSKRIFIKNELTLVKYLYIYISDHFFIKRLLFVHTFRQIKLFILANRLK